MDIETGWKPGTSNHDHHRGKYKKYIGSSMLKTCINYSFEQMHYDREHHKETEALLFGDRFHSIALEYEMGDIVVVPKIDRRTKKGKAQAAEFERKYADKRMVNQKDYNTIKAMVEKLHRHPIVGKLMKIKDREVTGLWNDVNNKLPCKIRPDMIDHDNKIIVDLKTCRSAAWVDANRDIFKLGYDISAAWYKWGAKEITGDDYTFIDVFIEKKPVHGITWWPIGGKIIRHAWQLIGDILGDLSDCMINNRWPGYSVEPCEPDIPAWRYR